MWDASATKNGVVIYDWETKSIPDAHLAKVFDEAHQQLLALGFSSPDCLRVGWIAYGEQRIMLSYGINRPVFDNSPDGRIVWTEQEVQEINQSANWDFRLEDALEAWGEPSNYVDDFEIGAYHRARLFWETCVKERLGIEITF